MNIQNVSVLFKHYRIAVKNLQKTCVATSVLHKSKGTRKMEKARKYRRPEDLEDPFYYGVGPKQKIEDLCQSLSSRGFGKELKNYTPPADVEEQLHKLCKKIFGSQLNAEWKSQTLNDKVIKYKLMTKAMELFSHEIPNSCLYKMKEVKDLCEFFSTPVQGSYHYDTLVSNREKLPPNLQVLDEGPRFNASTDTFFDGVTAFPGRRRIVYTKTGEKFEKIIEWPNL